MTPSRRAAATLAAVTLGGLVALPSSALAHGGATVAEGGRNGVTILVQAAEATTPAGKPAVDLSTVLEGKGTGDGAKVTYWIRPASGDTFRVVPENDETGVRHADVAIGSRGPWRDWDVSAVVTLTDGSRLRVTNAPDDAPGPDPSAPRPQDERDDAEAAPPAGTTTAASPAPAADSADARDDDAAPVSDISGEEDGAPSWAIPSVIVVAVLLVGGALLVRRRRSAG
ncbi:hypothetical protein [Patulibacter sp. SYSU D01012]|uniref:hypothetical protein n=1 Tax=Patulibacter sp. SYSU D01012 TaxID=2817381 RepID=UPI001B314465|nr:hypothetical protein [Patulibacter sp. SYSU D01012]